MKPSFKNSTNKFYILIRETFNLDTLHEIRDYLLKNKETLAVAESVTSGLLQAALAMVPDASKYFQGGITAYNLGQKYRHLLVEPIHAEDCDCVSQKVASTMALNVCPMFCSDWGIGISGYATPVKESGDNLYAYTAIAFNGKLISEKKWTPEETDPQKVQLFYVNSVISDLKTAMGAPG